MNPLGISAKRLACLLLPAFIYVCGVAFGGAWAGGDPIRVTEGGRISADLVDIPLNQVLADLSKKLPLHVKGGVGGGERLTLHFSDLTMEEALHKIMAGYNYVLMLSGERGEGTVTLTVVGKVSHPRSDLSAAEATPVSPPAAPNQQPSSVRPPALVPAVLPTPTAQPVSPPPAAASSPLPDQQPPAQPPASPPPTPAPDMGQLPPRESGEQPGSAATATPPGVLPPPESQPEFNPAAWGGKGRRK